ncbi:MAG: uncharacterized protein HW416_98 [Chloroflexi bacterium]|nr:uncharacterized protein [Chloroflexota bacterium]
MQPATTPETGSTAAVVPTIRHTVPWRVVSIEPLPNMRLRVSFVDGTAGEVDLGGFLTDPRVVGTVFESLRDPLAFAQAAVVMGAVQWPNGADLAPDTMYDAIREHGRWAPN